MEVGDAMQLKVLEDENRKLKGLVADLSLDNKILKDLLGKASNAQSEKSCGSACSDHLWAKRTEGLPVGQSFQIDQPLQGKQER
jgi:putative transposase